MASGNRAAEIIKELNELAWEIDDLGLEPLDHIIEAREEEGLPPLTEDELAAAQKEIDAKIDRANEIDAKIEDLRIESFQLMGKWPGMYGNAPYLYY